MTLVIAPPRDANAGRWVRRNGQLLAVRTVALGDAKEAQAVPGGISQLCELPPLARAREHRHMATRFPFPHARAGTKRSVITDGAALSDTCSIRGISAAASVSACPDGREDPLRSIENGDKKGQPPPAGPATAAQRGHALVAGALAAS